MSSELELIEILNHQYKSMEDTCDNLEGLIRKISGTIQALDQCDYERFTNPLRVSLSLMSEIHVELTKTSHALELERNRAVNESETPIVTGTARK